MSLIADKGKLGMLAEGSFGERLQSLRIEKGLSLHDVSKQTKLTVSYITYLEREDFSQLPGEVFVRGYLRSYAKLLKINESELLSAFNTIAPNATKKHTVRAPQSIKITNYSRYTRAPVKLIALLSLIVLCLLSLWWVLVARPFSGFNPQSLLRYSHTTSESSPTRYPRINTVDEEIKDAKSPSKDLDDSAQKEIIPSVGT